MSPRFTFNCTFMTDFYGNSLSLTGPVLFSSSLPETVGRVIFYDFGFGLTKSKSWPLKSKEFGNLVLTNSNLKLVLGSNFSCICELTKTKWVVMYFFRQKYVHNWKPEIDLDDFELIWKTLNYDKILLSIDISFVNRKTDHWKCDYRKVFFYVFLNQIYRFILLKSGLKIIHFYLQHFV